MPTAMRSFSLQSVVIVALFVYLGVHFLIPVYRYADTDLLWHLKQGQVIAETGKILQQDIFTHPPITDQNRATTLFQNSWLTDWLFFSVYNTLGFSGLVLLKALVLIIVLLTLFRLVLPLHFYGALAITLLIGEFITPMEIRPTVLSHLLLVWVLILWQYDRISPCWYYRLGLWGLMALWSNIHGLYLVGVGLLAVYLVTDYITLWLVPRQAPSVSDLRHRTITALGAMSATLLSPVGIKPFLSLWAINTHSEYYHLLTLVNEMQPLHQFISTMQPSLFISGLILTAIVLIWMAFNGLRQTAHLSDIMAVLALGVLTLLFARVMGLFVLGGLTIMAMTTHKPVLKVGVSTAYAYHKLIHSSLIIIFLLLAYFSWPQEPLGQFHESTVYPLQVTRFLEQHSLPGNLLNDANPGNYLMFKLHPAYRVFVDTRYLNLAELFASYTIWGAHPTRQADDPTTLDYVATIQPILNRIYQRSENYSKEYWQTLMQHYGIDFVVGRVTYPENGLIRPLFLKLLSQPDWHLLYADGYNVVIAQDNKTTHAKLQTLSHLPKNQLYVQILLESQRNSGLYAYESIAFALFMLGKTTESQAIARQILATHRSLVAEACLHPESAELK